MSTLDPPTTTWEQGVPNRLPELMAAIDQLESWLHSHRASPQACYLARLAAEEMGTNIIKYGYDDAAPHVITLRATALPGEFRLELVDDGHPFDPTERPEPSAGLSLDERKPGGWGISLIRRMAAGVTYDRRDSRNHLTIVVSRVPECG